MDPRATSPDARDSFIAYPANRVAGTIADRNAAEAVLHALVQAGSAPDDIDVLHGEAGLRRLDPEGTEHGLLARFQRALIHIAGANEEAVALQHHVDDVRAGRFVILVRAEHPDTRDRIAGILRDHGASFIGFFGRWTLQPLESTPENDQTAHPSVAGSIYEAHVGGVTAIIHIESEDVVHVALQGDESSVRAVSTVVRPDVLMTSWRQRDGAIVTQVNDMTNMVACVHMVTPDGLIRRMSGTLRRTNS
jgi:hypothetical protein